MITNVTTVTPHNAKVLTLDEVKAHLYISHTDEDDYLTALIAVATNLIDGPNGIGVPIQPATYQLTLDVLHHETKLPLEPATAVSEITQDGELIDPASYRLETGTTPQVIYSDTAYHIGKGGIKITFTAGHSEIPQELKHAALLLIGYYYAQREAVTDINLKEAPMAVQMLLDRHRTLVS